MNQALPATVNPSASVTVSAVVSNDPSNAGVDWQLVGPYGDNVGAQTGPSGQISAIHTASGATMTYTAPTYYPGGSLTLYARATANGASEATSTFNVPGNYTIAFTQAPPATMPANSSRSFYATLPGANASGLYINYSLSCSSTSSGGCGWLGGTGLTSWQDTSGDPVTYYSPAQVPSSKVVITASLAEASSVSTSASITITPPPTPPETVALTTPNGQGYGLPSSISASHALLIGANVTNDSHVFRRGLEHQLHGRGGDGLRNLVRDPQRHLILPTTVG